MRPYYVTVNLGFDVTVPVQAEDSDEAENLADEMELSELLDWAGCASFDANIVNVEEKK